MWMLAARISITSQGAARLLGWTLLIVTGFLAWLITYKRLGGESIGTWGQRAGGAPASLDTAVVSTLLIALVGGLFLFHARTGSVPAGVLHTGSVVVVLAPLVCHWIDARRERRDRE